MSKYRFTISCKNENAYRIDEILAWLSLMKKAFGIIQLYDSRSKPVPLDADHFTKICEKNIDSNAEELGFDFDLFSLPPKIKDDRTMRFTIHSGTSNRIDYYNDLYMVDFHKFEDMAKLIYFNQAIQLYNPIEAYIAELDNEFNMNTWERKERHPDKPAIIRFYHYLSDKYVEELGGIEKCLNAPAMKVERFCDGVLIKLFDELFDSENYMHIHAQRTIMKYFELSES